MIKSKLIIGLISVVALVDIIEGSTTAVYHVDAPHDVRPKDEKSASGGGFGKPSGKGPSLDVRKALSSSGPMDASVDMPVSSFMPVTSSVPEGVQLVSDGGFSVKQSVVQPIKPIDYVSNNPSTAIMIDPAKVIDSHQLQRVETDRNKLQTGTYVSTVKQYGSKMTE